MPRLAKLTGILGIGDRFAACPAGSAGLLHGIGNAAQHIIQLAGIQLGQYCFIQEEFLFEINVFLFHKRQK